MTRRGGKGKTLRAIATLLLLPLALAAGCSRSGPPAPVAGGGQPAALRAATPDQGRQTTIVVAPGDTVHALAQRHRVTMRDLIAANNLPPPYRLRVGQTLRMPSGREHTVRGGETLYEISRRYGVDLYTFAHLNNLAPPYTISHGQRLRLPGDGPAVAVATAPASGRQQPGRQQPGDPPARSAGPVTVEPMAPPPAVSAQAVSVPRPNDQNLASGARPAPARDEGPADPSQPQPMPRGPGESAPLQAQAQPQPQIQPQPGEARGAQAANDAEPQPRSAGRFLWPVRGRVISDFGPKPGGLHNDGINIAVPRGEPVQAAENGVVAYAGNELKGFGNLLLIRHADGWISAYAHNDTLLVKRGDAVRRGQVIARAGATGNVNTPQVHFELRRGTRAVDPRGQLVGQTAALN